MLVATFSYPHVFITITRRSQALKNINSYLVFDGNCREVMTFYKECLGGELTMQTAAETPMADQMPPEFRNSIMHARITNGKGEPILMASDMMGKEPLVLGNSCTLSIECET